jgi:hypothetical protein
MRRLLKYAFVLALGIAIGAYIVLDNIAPDTAEQGEIAARSEAAPPATPASIEEEELEYSVATRLASLDGWRAFLAAHPNGAHAQSARAEIARRFGASTASADGSAAAPPLSPTDNEQGDALSQRLGSLASHAQSATAKVERLLLAGKVPASGGPEASGAASSETRSAVPGTDAAAGAKLAALGEDEICRRDEDRLAQLRMNPSRGEAERFASELGCEKLRPQVLALFESLGPAPAPAEPPGAASAGAQTENEKAHPAAPPASADAASPLSDAICKRDEDRLVRLRSSPSGDEALRFENELGCEKLRPQLQRLMESLGAPAPPPPAPALADSSRQNPLLDQPCATERSALDRLRQAPSAEAAGLFWREMQCEGLRPQVRLLLESLNVAPDSVGSAAQPGEPEARRAISDAPAAAAMDPAACRRETAELNRVRATPDLDDAKRFASALTCDALKPQVARLLESFGD